MPDGDGFCTLKGHVALITGASGGIGSAIAMELARAGASVAAHYNQHEANAAKVVDEVRSIGGKADSFKCDLRNLDAIPGLVDEVAEKLGPPDILINNAGINLEGFIVKIQQDDIDHLFKVNLLSTFQLSKECVKYMLKLKWGRIIFISSPAAIAGSPGQAAYAASKAGLHGFSKSLSLELGKRNITSNVIVPGIVETAMLQGLTDTRRDEFLGRIPLRRFAQPAEVAKFVRYVASDEAAYLNGQELHFNGGGVIF